MSFKIGDRVKFRNPLPYYETDENGVAEGVVIGMEPVSDTGKWIIRVKHTLRLSDSRLTMNTRCREEQLEKV